MSSNIKARSLLSSILLFCLLSSFELQAAPYDRQPPQTGRASFAEWEQVPLRAGPDTERSAPPEREKHPLSWWMLILRDSLEGWIATLL